MSRFLVRGKYFTTEHIWFEEGIQSNIISDYKIIHGSSIQISDLHGYKNNIYKQETLITDLSYSEDELFSCLNRTLRYQINRSKRENISTKVWNSKDIEKDIKILNNFSQIYENMYKEKGMSGRRLNLNELKEYIKRDAITITTASIDDKIVIFHSYIHDNKHVRLLHSCSEFRATDNVMRNAIGRANKYLHWNDLIYFKQIGIKEYDWGGIASFDNPNGIDKFKMSFGGLHKVYYNIRYICSWRAKLYAKIKNILIIIGKNKILIKGRKI